MQVAKKKKRSHSIFNISAVGLGSLSAVLSSATLATALTGFGIVASPALVGVATVVGLFSVGGVFCWRLERKVTKHKKIYTLALAKHNSVSELVSKGILEKLHLIYENLCFATGVKAAQQYHEEKPAFTNERIKACQEYGGAFSLKCGSAELTCVNCGRIEILDGTAFAPQKPYNVSKKSRPTRKYTFKYSLNRFLDDCKFLPTQLTPKHIDEANCIFEHIEGQLPNKISYPSVIYKILEKIIPNGPQRMLLNCIKLPATHLKHEQRWNNAFRNSGIIF